MDTSTTGYSFICIEYIWWNMLTPQTDSVNCLALVRYQSVIVKCIFCFIYCLFFYYHTVYGEIKVVYIHALRILRVHGIPKNSIYIRNRTRGTEKKALTTANGLKLNPSSDMALTQDWVLPDQTYPWLICSKMLMTICLTVFCTIMNMF